MVGVKKFRRQGKLIEVLSRVVSFYCDHGDDNGRPIDGNSLHRFVKRVKLGRLWELHYRCLHCGAIKKVVLKHRNRSVTTVFNEV